MLHFNELKISQDNRFLIIDVSVDNQTYFQNVFLDSIVIDTQNTFVPNGPSSKPIYTYTATEDVKNIRLVLDSTTLQSSLCGNMFFVYVISKGEATPDTPCGLDKDKITGTVVNLKSIYEEALKYMKQVNCSCEIPKGFIDMILRFKALELCIRTGNYTQAIKYWNKFFSKLNCVLSNSNCECYG